MREPSEGSPVLVLLVLGLGLNSAELDVREMGTK